MQQEVFVSLARRERCIQLHGTRWIRINFISSCKSVYKFFPYLHHLSILIGTFQAEEEEVVYGLTHPINTFEPNVIQVCISKILIHTSLYQYFCLLCISNNRNLIRERLTLLPWKLDWRCCETCSIWQIIAANKIHVYQ